MKLVAAWLIKRPSGTRPFSPINPAMNRRATFAHSSGMMEFLKRDFRKGLLYGGGYDVYPKKLFSLMRAATSGGTICSQV